MEKGSSSSFSSFPPANGNGGGPDSLNGLKFGKKIYYEGVSSGLPSKTGGGPPPSPSKKVRTGFVQGGQPPRCQVEGCKLDLSDAKAYYSRHKVCGMHSKSAKVIVAGLEQRFCQQCSRFHQLPEFDQGKRSCRRRLAGHNERRRKPQGSLSSPRYGNLFPSMFDNNHNSKPGGFVMDFSTYPSSLTGRDSFPNSTSERGLTTNQAAITGKLQIPLLSNSQNPLSTLLTNRPSYDCPIVSSQECFNGVSDSSNALSLLSNQPWPASKSRLGANDFLGQPSDNSGATISQFACSSWDFKGNGDLGLGQTSQTGNGEYNGGLGLGHPSEGQLDEMDQTRGYDSSSFHNMHWSL